MSIFDMSLEITILKLQPHLLGVNELNQLPEYLPSWVHQSIQRTLNANIKVSLSLSLALSLSSPLTLGIVGSYVTNGNFQQFPYTTDSLFAQAGTFTSILFIGVIAMPFLFQYLNSNENKQQSAMIFAAPNCKDLN